MNEKMIRCGLRMVNYLVPKRQRRIYLRSSFLYPDNIQAILDEMLRRGINEKYEIICVGNGFEGYEFHNMVKVKDKTMNAIMYFLRSKYVIWDVGIFFGIPYNIRQISVNLWHGTSLKKIGFYEEKEKPYRTSKYAISYSDLFAEKISKAFGIPLEDVLITGEPRNDYLFEPASDQILNKLDIPITEGCRYIIWMPTFRQSKNHNVNNGKRYEFGFPFINNENLNDLNQFAKRNNTILILKWHGSQVLPSDSMKTYSNLVFVTTEAIAKLHIPFYNVVARCDALITDYSSIYVNYMVLDRPMCFAYDDLDEYIKDRGFMFEDVEKIMPGYKAHSFENILSFIEDVSKGLDEFKDEREKQSSLLNRYNDKYNSKRLVDYLAL